MKPSVSQFVDVRGLRYHVRTWGDARARKLILLHGWMDVSASFQFLVDALTADWQVLAPDWRGFGLSAWPHEGYWFADYVADLDGLVRALSPDAPRRHRRPQPGRQRGADVRRAAARTGQERRVARRVRHSRRGAGRRAEEVHGLAGRAGSAAGTLRSTAASRRWPIACRRTMRGCRATRRSSWPRIGARRCRTAPRGCAPTRATSCPFPNVYRLEEVFAIWRNIAAPALWVAADDSDIPALAGRRRRPAAEIARRMAHVPGARLVTIADAGHMLHHDQPEAVAHALETFLA